MHQERSKKGWQHTGIAPKFIGELLKNPNLRHEDTDGDPEANNIVALGANHESLIEQCRSEGLNVEHLMVTVEKKTYRRQPNTREEKIAHLVRDGISSASLWYTIGAEPMNCDIVLDAIIQRAENELAEKRRKTNEKKTLNDKLKAEVVKIRAKGTNPAEWNHGDLKTMLRYKMNCKGHTKFVEKEEILEQYNKVANDESDCDE